MRDAGRLRERLAAPGPAPRVLAARVLRDADVERQRQYGRRVAGRGMCASDGHQLRRLALFVPWCRPGSTVGTPASPNSALRRSDRAHTTTHHRSLQPPHLKASARHGVRMVPGNGRRQNAARASAGRTWTCPGRHACRASAWLWCKHQPESIRGPGCSGGAAWADISARMTSKRTNLSRPPRRRAWCAVLAPSPPVPRSVYRSRLRATFCAVALVWRRDAVVTLC